MSSHTSTAERSELIAPIPAQRVEVLSKTGKKVQDGDYVIYWMVAHRRTRWNYSLQHAMYLAQRHNKGLIVLEALRLDYPWASQRIHRFIAEGMQDNASAIEGCEVAYYPYIEASLNTGRGLLAALSKRAIAVVTDLFPCFFLPRMQARAAEVLDAPMHRVDSNGILPLAASERVYTTAASFRRHLQKTLRPHLGSWPVAEPLQHSVRPVAIPDECIERWPPTDLADLDSLLDNLPVDNEVEPVPFRGGAKSAENQLTDFLSERHGRYHEDRNRIDNGAASGLSPYLHFGHLSAHEFAHRALAQCGWSPDLLAEKPNGSRNGWWGLPPHTESLMDELITWRELGYVFCHQRLEDYDQFETLPGWAVETLENHSSDPRPVTYTLEQLETASTHDPVWNAAQRQLRQEGRIHNYLRMLWGKKILEWSPSPQEALKRLIHLNNRWAIDGRNPNSYSGIFWTLGRFDRAWGPVRPIFGKIRYMSSESTARKIRLKGYLQRYGEDNQLPLIR